MVAECHAAMCHITTPAKLCASVCVGCQRFTRRHSEHIVGRDSSVGIATAYRLDGPGIESRWGWDFPHPSRPALGPTQPPVQWVPGLSRGYSGGGGADHPPPSKCRGQEREGLYLYSPSGPSLSVMGAPLPLTYSEDIATHTKRKDVCSGIPRSGCSI